MGNIKKLLIITLVFSFAVSISSCASNHGYKKGKTKKRGCNCPHFSADIITWEAATKEKV